MATAKQKKSDSDTDADETTGYSDVSTEAEALAADPEDTEAAAVINAEMAQRSSAAANGGGAFPPDVLRRNYTGATRMSRPVPEYTSHEDQE